MSAGSSLLFGLVAGAVGAGVWAFISISTGYEIGWIAWGVGLAVGVGVRLGAGERTDPALGIQAAVIAMLAVAAGKFGVVLDAAQMDREVVLAAAAQEVAAERMADGEAFVSPSGVPLEYAWTEADFPPAIWGEAEAWFYSLTPEEQAAAEETLASMLAFDFAGAAMATLSPFDLLWFGLAMVTAYQLGAGSSKHEHEQEGPPQHAHLHANAPASEPAPSAGPIPTRMPGQVDDDIPPLSGRRDAA